MRPGSSRPRRGGCPDGPPNPEDGVVDLRYTITHDLATGGYAHTLVGRAGAGDVDGLWSWGQIPAADATGEPDTEAWRDVLGLYFALAPLAAPTRARRATRRQRRAAGDRADHTAGRDHARPRARAAASSTTASS